MPVNPPSETGRGFRVYGGSAVNTSYGHPVEIRVQESSAASGPHVWLFIGHAPGMKDRDPHLSLADAIEIRDRLTQFIDEVPERWTRGAEFAQEAQEEVARRRAAEREEKIQ